MREIKTDLDENESQMREIENRIYKACLSTSLSAKCRFLGTSAPIDSQAALIKDMETKTLDNAMTYLKKSDLSCVMIYLLDKVWNTVEYIHDMSQKSGKGGGEIAPFQIVPFKAVQSG